jgi:protein-disulfide isomerase
MRAAHLLALSLALSTINAADLRKALEEHPEILIEALKTNSKSVLEVITVAAKEEQARAQREAEEAEKKGFEDAFTHPLQAAIDATRARGASGARFTLVEYADFECPYCQQAFQTVEELRKKYGPDLRVVFKNLPLPFHPQAMPAAQWLEAIAIQSPEKAWRFHDTLFQNQDKLGGDFFRRTAKELGVDVERCARDAESQAIKDRIAADVDEARRLGFSGTPGFLLNGVPIRGAYPAEHFTAIMRRLEE